MTVLTDGSLQLSTEWMLIVNIRIEMLYETFLSDVKTCKFVDDAKI